MAPKKPSKKKTVTGKKMKPLQISKKASAVTKPFTKTEILNEIGGMLDMKSKQVAMVVECLVHIIERHLKKGGCGLFVLPGLLKCQVIHKPATKARKGINPFTGLETMFKAKPARNIVKIKPLKKLKDMV